MNLQENIQRIKEVMGLINETSEEEAWELVGQDHKVIKKIVSDKGYNNDEESVERLVPIIDNLPTQEVSYKQIKNFHNLENKEGDKGLIKKMYQISKENSPREEYEKFMKQRDKGENRDRGYDPVKNFDRIVSNEYESPVVLEYDSEYYVVGGRTRLYASIAAGLPIKIKVIRVSDL